MDCHAICTLKIYFVDFEKEPPYCGRYRRHNFSSLPLVCGSHKLFPSPFLYNVSYILDFSGMFKLWKYAPCTLCLIKAFGKHPTVMWRYNEIAKHTLDFMYVFILYSFMTFWLTYLTHKSIYIEIDFFLIWPQAPPNENIHKNMNVWKIGGILKSLVIQPIHISKWVDIII